VTLAVASGIKGVAETWITAVPCATPVTGTVSVEGEPPFGRKVSCSGTVATPVALELKVTVIPLGGAAPERVSVKFCVAVPTIVRLVGA
jgi:hypothetical protein